MILLTGATGRLGTAIRTLLPEAMTPGRAELDLADPGSVGAALGEIRPSGIINCAAYTDVDGAETDPELADAVNHRAVAVMADHAAAADIPFITFSTDYVFDGRSTIPYVESTAANPVNAYGRSKLLGEEAALRHPRSLVIRTSWLFSATHHSFVWWVLREARAGAVGVVASETGSPTFAPDLARAVIEAIDGGVTGLLHVANSGAASRLELAHRTCELAGLDPDRVQSISARNGGARRPGYSVLASERIPVLPVTRLRAWDEALAEMLSTTQPPTTASNPGPAGRSS